MNLSVYTDGACRGNPGVGGWGFYIPSENVAIYGGSIVTTNNKMELTAIAKALRYVIDNLSDKVKVVAIHTDSAYCLNALTNWIYNWIESGWLNAKKQPVANQELFQSIIKLRHSLEDLGISLNFVKVKGHSTDVGNNKADALANKGADYAKGLKR